MEGQQQDRISSLSGTSKAEIARATAGLPPPREESPSSGTRTIRYMYEQVPAGYAEKAMAKVRAGKAPSDVVAVYTGDVTEPSRDGTVAHVVVCDGRKITGMRVGIARSLLVGEVEPDIIEAAVERRAASLPAATRLADLTAHPILALRRDDLRPHASHSIFG